MIKKKSVVLFVLLTLLAVPGFGQIAPFTPPASLPSGMEFVSIPDGSFQMGSSSSRHTDEYPRHSVSVSSFELMTTEVTQGMWEDVMGKDIRDQRDLFGSDWPLCGEGSNYPIYYVSWNDCQEFIDVLNNIDPNHTYRLPTEAEWEYACRAGSSSAYYWGNSSCQSTSDESTMKQYCWYDRNARSAYYWTSPHAQSSGTQPVGTKQANAWGFYDMSGNVWEWCQDVYTNDYSECPTNGSAYIGQWCTRVRRGGSWYDDFESCRSAYRNSDGPDRRFYNLGLRIARS